MSDSNRTIMRLRHPGMIVVGRRASSAASDAATAVSASIHRTRGIGAVEIAARAWNSVRVKPGQNAWTYTPRPATSGASASIAMRWYALVAQ